jgi:hypothetical protein
MLKNLCKFTYDLLFRYWSPKYYLMKEQLRQAGIEQASFSNPPPSVFNRQHHHHRSRL